MHDSSVTYPAGESSYGVGIVDVMVVFEKAYGVKVTTRTWGTIEKILASADS